MYHILLVEDDRNIQTLIANYFTKKEKDVFAIEIASDGQTGLEKAYENHYDCLLLDVMLPELDGFEICREIRRESDVPIIFITARTDESDMLNGYALGCDDYVVKPFPLPVLYQKVNALIKRSKGLVRSKVFSSGSLSLNPNNGVVVSADSEVKLTAREYGIMTGSLRSIIQSAVDLSTWHIAVPTRLAWMLPSSSSQRFCNMRTTSAGS